ncbi:hypothetical protein CSUI_007167, partial [Cystoisospora suis]
IATSLPIKPYYACLGEFCPFLPLERFRFLASVEFLTESYDLYISARKEEETFLSRSFSFFLSSSYKRSLATGETVERRIGNLRIRVSSVVVYSEIETKEKDVVHSQDRKRGEAFLTFSCFFFFSSCSSNVKIVDKEEEEKKKHHQGHSSSSSNVTIADKEEEEKKKHHQGHPPSPSSLAPRWNMEATPHLSKSSSSSFFSRLHPRQMSSLSSPASLFSGRSKKTSIRSKLLLLLFLDLLVVSLLFLYEDGDKRQAFPIEKGTPFSLFLLASSQITPPSPPLSSTPFSSSSSFPEELQKPSFDQHFPPPSGSSREKKGGAFFKSSNSSQSRLKNGTHYSQKSISYLRHKQSVKDKKHKTRIEEKEEEEEKEEGEDEDGNRQNLYHGDPALESEREFDRREEEEDDHPLVLRDCENYVLQGNLTLCGNLHVDGRLSIMPGVNGTEIFSSLPNHDYLIHRCVLHSLPRSSSLRLEGSSLFVAGSVHVAGSVTATEILLDSGAELLVGLRGSRESLRTTMQADGSKEEEDSRGKDLRREKEEEEKKKNEEKLKEKRRGQKGGEDSSRHSSSGDSSYRRMKEESSSLSTRQKARNYLDKKEIGQNTRSGGGETNEEEEERKTSREKKNYGKKKNHLIFITRTYEPMDEWMSSDSITLQQAGVAYFDKNREHSLSIDINCPFLDIDGIPFTNQSKKNPMRNPPTSFSSLRPRRKLNKHEEEKDPLPPTFHSQEKQDQDAPAAAAGVVEQEEEEEEEEYSSFSSFGEKKKRSYSFPQSVGDLNVGRLMMYRSSHVVVYGNTKASIAELSGASYLNSLCGAFLSDLDSPGIIVRDSSIATFSGLGVNLFSNLYTRGSSFFYTTGPAQIAFETQASASDVYFASSLVTSLLVLDNLSEAIIGGSVEVVNVASLVESSELLVLGDFLSTALTLFDGSNSRCEGKIFDVGFLKLESNAFLYISPLQSAYIRNALKLVQSSTMVVDRVSLLLVDGMIEILNSDLQVKKGSLIVQSSLILNEASLQIHGSLSASGKYFSSPSSAKKEKKKERQDGKREGKGEKEEEEEEEEEMEITQEMLERSDEDFLVEEEREGMRGMHSRLSKGIEEEGEMEEDEDGGREDRRGERRKEGKGEIQSTVKERKDKEDKRDPDEYVGEEYVSSSSLVKEGERRNTKRKTETPDRLVNGKEKREEKGEEVSSPSSSFSFPQKAKMSLEELNEEEEEEEEKSYGPSISSSFDFFSPFFSPSPASFSLQTPNEKSQRTHPSPNSPSHAHYINSTSHRNLHTKHFKEKEEEMPISSSPFASFDDKARPKHPHGKKTFPSPRFLSESSSSSSPSLPPSPSSPSSPWGVHTAQEDISLNDDMLNHVERNSTLIRLPSLAAVRSSILVGGLVLLRNTFAQLSSRSKLTILGKGGLRVAGAGSFQLFKGGILEVRRGDVHVDSVLSLLIHSHLEVHQGNVLCGDLYVRTGSILVGVRGDLLVEGGAEISDASEVRFLHWITIQSHGLFILNASVLSGEAIGSTFGDIYCGSGSAIQTTGGEIISHGSLIIQDRCKV